VIQPLNCHPEPCLSAKDLPRYFGLIGRQCGSFATHFQPGASSITSGIHDCNNSGGPSTRAFAFAQDDRYRDRQDSCRNISRGILVLLMFLLSTAKSFAQGCASCYTTAAAGGPQTAHALRSGILVLLIPPVLIFSSIMFLLWRWRSARSSVSVCLQSGFSHRTGDTCGADESAVVPEREMAQ